MELPVCSHFRSGLIVIVNEFTMPESANILTNQEITSVETSTKTIYLKKLLSAIFFIFKICTCY